MRCRRSKQLETMKGLAFFGSYGAITTETTVNNAALLDEYTTTEEGVVFNRDGIYHTGMAVILTNVVPNSALEFTMYPGSSGISDWFIFLFEDGSYVFRQAYAQTTLTISVPNSTIVKIIVGGAGIVGSRPSLDSYKFATISYSKYVHAKIPTEDGKSFAEKQEGVACSLTQRLSIIKGELWYQVNTGLPLFEKYVSSTTLDAWIIKTCMSHPDVVSIESFASRKEGHTYHCNLVIITKFGELELAI